MVQQQQQSLSALLLLLLLQATHRGPKTQSRYFYFAVDIAAKCGPIVTYRQRCYTSPASLAQLINIVASRSASDCFIQAID